MGLQLKGENGTERATVTSEQNPWDTPKKVENPWDVPGKEDDLLKIEEPKVVYNTAMAEMQGKQKESNPVAGMIVKIIIALVVCGLIIFVGKKIVSVVRPEGEDITKYLGQNANTVAKELGLTLTDSPHMEANIYQYSKGTVSVKGTEDLGIVYIDNKQMGVHIPTKKYTIFGVQVGDGEREMYNRTSYPYDSSTSILNTMSGKGTVYIYYNRERNDCIVFYINNTTNRIESMTYFNDYKKVTETLENISE